MAAIRTADIPRVLGNGLLASRQHRIRASQPAYLRFVQAKLALTHWIVKWVERLQLRPEKRPIKKTDRHPMFSLTNLPCLPHLCIPSPVVWHSRSYARFTKPLLTRYESYHNDLAMSIS